MAARSSLSRLLLGQRGAPAALERVLADLRAQGLLLALIGCYLAIGLAASLLIPPWQSPDEPTHFEYARGLAIGNTAETPVIQAPIIASFYRYRFWDYRDVPAPNPAPASFSELQRLLLRQTDKAPLYYWLAAAVSDQQQHRPANADDRARNAARIARTIGARCGGSGRVFAYVWLYRRVRQPRHDRRATRRHHHLAGRARATRQAAGGDVRMRAALRAAGILGAAQRDFVLISSPPALQRRAVEHGTRLAVCTP